MTKREREAVARKIVLRAIDASGASVERRIARLIDVECRGMRQPDRVAVIDLADDYCGVAVGRLGAFIEAELRAIAEAAP